MSGSDLNHWLSTTLVFQGLSPLQLVPLTKISQVQTFSKGDLIFKQGKEAIGFFVIKIGRVKVFKVSTSGKEQILNIFDAGDNFAEVAALDGQYFPASAMALEPVILLFFPRTEFLSLLHQHPDIAVNMLISLAQHSRHLVGIIEDLSFKDVPQRLAAYLLKLVDSQRPAFEHQTHLTSVVTLDITKSHLAAALGTIPATLSRAFYRLSSDRIISMQGPQIEILDRDRLRDLSQLADRSIDISGE